MDPTIALPTRSEAIGSAKYQAQRFGLLVRWLGRGHTLHACATLPAVWYTVQEGMCRLFQAPML